MKNQVLFSSKDKSKELKCRLLQFFFGALRVNVNLLNRQGNKKTNGMTKAIPIRKKAWGVYQSTVVVVVVVLRPR